MNRRPLQPLDAEERALADQLARLGPHGEPSAKLDARILAAAHDAVHAPAVPARRRPRWPVGVGVAASAMLAVAVAWQLRPMTENPEALDRPATAAATGASEPVQVFIPPPQATPVIRFETAAPPPPPEAMARVANTPSTEPAAAASAVPNKVIAPPQRAARPASGERAARPAIAAAPREVADAYNPPVRAAEASAQERYDVDYAGVPAAPAPAPPASALTLDSVSVASSSDFGYVADPETTAAVAARRELARAEHARTATAAAEAAEQAEARSRASQASAEMQDAVPPAPSAGRATQSYRAAKASPATSGSTRNGLKRTDLQLPVAEDTKLEADAWLERIRLRRDLGDRTSATDSLLRFKQQHPFQKVPEDLKELLGE